MNAVRVIVSVVAVIVVLLSVVAFACVRMAAQIDREEAADPESVLVRAFGPNPKVK